MSNRLIKYAGIGSQETPDDVCRIMERLGARLMRRGFMVRSGGAIGADQAFVLGAGATNAQVLRANDATPAAHEHAARFHPAWGRLSVIARSLHARNSMIVLGRSLDDPVDFVVCWTPKGEWVGGTSQALRVAKDNGIRIFNLFYETPEDIDMWLKGYDS